MKKCPYCSGPVIDEAVKCRHCGEWLKSYSELIEDEQPESATDYLPVMIGIPLLLLLHFLSGYLQTPRFLIESGLSEGIRAVYLRSGYGIGVTLIYALPVPLLCASLSLLIHRLRTVTSFTQIIFWCMIITLLLNAAVGFFIAPRALQQINIQISCVNPCIMIDDEYQG